MAEEIAKLFLLPSNLMGLLVLCGAGCLPFRRIRRFAFGPFCAAGLLFLALANGPVSFFLIHNLETRNPAFPAERHPGAAFEEIVVLTGHALPDARLPASSRVNASSAFRILEATRLHRLYPEARITISGHGDVPLLMKRLLAELGVPEGAIAVEDASRSTFESAVHIEARVGERPFLLVTSAGHMPRSLEAFRRLGMNPTPAPTDYLAKMDPFGGNLLPSAGNLMRADLALHELIGLWWYRLTRGDL